MGNGNDHFAFVAFLVFLVVMAAFGIFITTSRRGRSYSKRLKLVKTGDKLKVNISGFVVDAVCLNNSPETNRMHVRMFMSGGKQSDSVEQYSDFAFHNFDALNPVIGKDTKKYSTKDHLEDLLKKALENEKYEDAAVLRDAISKLEKEPVL